jgi:hypothetical protein
MVKALRTHVRLLAASWLLAQAVCLGLPVWAMGAATMAELAADLKCGDVASAGRICPMRQSDGATCPMHRSASRQTACKLTAACGAGDDMLGAAFSPLAGPLETSSLATAVASTRATATTGAVPHSLSSPPDAPPPRA